MTRSARNPRRWGSVFYKISCRETHEAGSLEGLRSGGPAGFNAGCDTAHARFRETHENSNLDRHRWHRHCRDDLPDFQLRPDHFRLVGREHVDAPAVESRLNDFSLRRTADFFHDASVQAKVNLFTAAKIVREGKFWRASDLLHETGFQSDGAAVDLAGDLVIAIDQPNAFRLRAAFDDLRRAFELQILDQGDRVAVREHLERESLRDEEEVAA